MRIRYLLAISILFGPFGAATATVVPTEADKVLSPEFRRCFGKDAPLNAESYPCLDREYRRLETVLTREYSEALARQSDETARHRLKQQERVWWRKRFRHCKDDVGDLS